MPSLLLVRHTATALNAARRYQGHVDPPLDRTGTADAIRLGGYLRRRLASGEPDPPARRRTASPVRIACSDLRRARATARLALPGRVAVPEARLRELDFGAFDGAAYEDNLRTHRDRFRAWVDDPVEVAPPGGETVRELEARVLDWAAALPDDARVVVFTHGGPIRVLAAHARGVPFMEVRAMHVPLGAVVPVTLRPRTTAGRTHGG